MAAIIEARRFWNPALGETVADATDYPSGNVLDVLSLEIDFRIEDYTVVNTVTEGDGDNFIVVKPNSSTTLLAGNDNLIYFELDGIIDDWNVGDTVTISGSSGSNGSYQITEFISGNIIRVDNNFTQEILPQNTIVANTTPIQGVEFSHNLVGNDEAPNFFSKVDGAERKAIATGLDNDVATPTVMTQLGNKSHQYGEISIKGNVSGLALNADIAQGFTISQTLLIDPIVLFSQIPDLKKRIAPDYLLDSESLKFVFEVQANKDVNDPNKKQEIVEGEVQGNIGWYNENRNTKLTNYSIEEGSLIYKKGTSINTSLEITTDETTIEFILVNTIDTPFSTGNTLFELNFALALHDETEYRDELPAIERDVITNFLLDKTRGELGTLSTTPDNLGTDNQIVKSVDFIPLTSSRCKILVTVDMAIAATARIGNLTEPDFLIAISTQAHFLSGKDTDRVCYLVDVQEMFVETSDPTMIDIVLSAMPHTGTDIDTESIIAPEILEARKLDDILFTAKVVLDRNGREDDEISITGMRFQIIASNGTEEFELDRDSRSLISQAQVNGNTFIDGISEDRGFRTPVDINRANVQLFSRTALDGAGLFNYQYQFPVVFRWETWEPLDPIEPLDGNADAFHDTTQDNNGFNHDWNRYDNATGWDLYYRVRVSALKNGSPQVYTAQSIMNSHNYTEGLEWDTESITLTDIASGNAVSILQKYVDCRIKGFQTFIGTTTPDITDLVIVLNMNVYRSSNFKDLYTTSSMYANHPDTLFKGINGGNKLVIDDSLSPIFIGIADTDQAKMPDDIQFKLTGRIYDKRDPVPFPLAGAKMKEDGTFKRKEDGTFKRKE